MIDRRTSLGYKPDRRHLFGIPSRSATPVLSALPPPPPRASMADTVVSILDQGAAPFCVSHAIMQAVRCCQVRNGVARPRLGSRLWLMYLMHALEHDVDGFDGAVISDGFKVIERLGIPPEDAWPYSDSSDGNYKVKPPTDVFRQAFDRIAPNDYGRILEVGSARIDAVKRAIAAKYPVVFGTQVSEEFCAGRLGTGAVVDVPTGLAIAGGHALEIVGYEDDPAYGTLFDVVNSWTENWGDRGHFRMTARYLDWSNTEDVWFTNFQGAES